MSWLGFDLLFRDIAGKITCKVWKNI